MNPSIVVAGVGNSGVALLDILALGRPDLKGLLAVNNDEESLRASVAHVRIGMPEGDPSDGFLAIDGAFGEALEGAGTLILCGGLGGVTGSFLMPALAAHAKASGRVVLACAGIPFSFEGKERRTRALAALGKLRSLSDAVAVIDNDRFAAGSAVTSSVGEAFRLADGFLVSSVLSLRSMIGTSGPVRISRNDIQAVLGPSGGGTYCSFGSAVGDNRLHEALEKSLAGPLLLKGGKASSLREAERVLLLLEGGNDISFAEVQTVVAEIERIVPAGCQIRTGVAAQGPAGSPLSLSLFVSVTSPVWNDHPEKTGAEASSGNSGRRETLSPEPKASAEESAVSSKPVSLGAKGTRSSQAKPVPKPSTSKATQGTFDLVTNQRGRFDKSEPTIIGGEDLDVPTFLRKGVKLPVPPRR